MKNKLIILNVLDKILTIWVIVKIFMLLGIVGGIEQGGSYKNLLYLLPIGISLIENIFVFNEIDRSVKYIKRQIKKQIYLPNNKKVYQ